MCIIDIFIFRKIFFSNLIYMFKEYIDYHDIFIKLCMNKNFQEIFYKKKDS